MRKYLIITTLLLGLSTTTSAAYFNVNVQGDPGCGDPVLIQICGKLCQQFSVSDTDVRIQGNAIVIDVHLDLYCGPPHCGPITDITLEPLCPDIYCVWVNVYGVDVCCCPCSPCWCRCRPRLLGMTSSWFWVDCCCYGCCWWDMWGCWWNWDLFGRCMWYQDDYGLPKIR